MKYEVTKTEEGTVTLQLGLSNSVHFPADATIEDIVNGIENLIQAVIGVSLVELAMAVVRAYEGDVAEPVAE